MLSGIHMKMLTTVILIVLFSIQNVYGDDFFDSLNVRLECYKTTQKGCNEDLVDAYPEVGWSYTNTTRADTHFYLFTKENPDEPELLHKCAGGLPPDSNFNPQCRTEFLIPGFFSGICNFAIYRELKYELLKRKSCTNVILVDFMWGNSFELVEAKDNLKIVARQIAIIIRNLKKKFQLGPEDFMLIGHSYGAHLAGFVGQVERITKIIGLDPAGILFGKETPLEDRLDAGDADCVEVVHCNGGQCLPLYFGTDINCGTVDFWVNGGLFQASCYPKIPQSFIKKDFIYGLLQLLPPGCSHLQCLEYYKASINPTGCQFVGVQCDSYEDFQAGKCRDCGKSGENCVVMGEYTCDCLSSNITRTKSYYLNTDKKCPYCDNSGINLGGLKCPVAGIY